MVRYVDRLYIIELIDQSYINQERNCNFCSKLNRTFCQISTDLEKQEMLVLIQNTLIKENGVYHIFFVKK